MISQQDMGSRWINAVIYLVYTRLMPAHLQQQFHDWDAVAHRFWVATVFNVHHSTRRPHWAPVSPGKDSDPRATAPAVGVTAATATAVAGGSGCCCGGGDSGDGDGCDSAGFGDAEGYYCSRGGAGTAATASALASAHGELACCESIITCLTMVVR